MKTRFSTQVDAEVVDAVRATVVALQRLHGPSVTLGAFVTGALAEAVDRAQAEYNGGEPFPPTNEALAPGSRIRSTP